MKKFLLSALLAATTLLAYNSSAQAQVSRIYLAGYMGLNTGTDQNFLETQTNNSGDFEFDNAVTFAGALGIRLSRQLRLEGELSYRNKEMSNVDIAGSGVFQAEGEIDSTIVMANLYYDFDVPWKTQPYIGGGIGYGWFGGETDDVSGILVNEAFDDQAFVWNIGGGFKYRPRSDFAWTAGYRYLASADLEFGNYEIDNTNHEFRLGIEWDLPTR